MSDSRADSFRDVTQIAEQKADFSTFTIADSGHNMYMDQPERVAVVVRSFAADS